MLMDIVIGVALGILLAQTLLAIGRWMSRLLRAYLWPPLRVAAGRFWRVSAAIAGKLWRASNEPLVVEQMISAAREIDADRKRQGRSLWWREEFKQFFAELTDRETWAQVASTAKELLHRKSK